MTIRMFFSFVSKLIHDLFLMRKKVFEIISREKFNIHVNYVFYKALPT